MMVVELVNSSYNDYSCNDRFWFERLELYIVNDNDENNLY